MFVVAVFDTWLTSFSSCLIVYVHCEHLEIASLDNHAIRHILEEIFAQKKMFVEEKST